MGPLRDIWEAEIEHACRHQAWLLCNTYLRHLIKDGSTQAFNAALEELAKGMRETILKHPPAPA